MSLESLEEFLLKMFDQRERVVYNAFQVDEPGQDWAEQGMGVEKRKHLELPW